MGTRLELLCSWLGGQAEVFTLPEIQEKMKSFSEPGEGYSVLSWLGKKPQVKQKDLIYITRFTEMPNMVCFIDMANCTFLNEERPENHLKPHKPVKTT